MGKLRQIVFFFCAQLIILGNTVTIDEFGYYKLVIGIDERTIQNTSINFVENVKRGIQDFSDLLHHVTNGKFAIKEVDILIPDHWIAPTDGVASTQYYEGADIKVSHTFTLPYTNNPFACGHPGQDIQLPYNFFDNGDQGPYGRVGKALIPLFARLRFGVWEEHGYPGDSLFPYFTRPLEGGPWEVNVCTDAPIEGTFKNLTDGSICTNTTDLLLYPPPNECRFFPNASQVAKSSLMSYHYLPTFESFCNSETHDRQKPTPQNYYCVYKSVMEVIQETSDWRQTIRENQGGRVDIRVVKSSPQPLFYILLDAGITEAPDQVLEKVSIGLSTFINSPEVGEIVAGVGKFPGEMDTSYTEVVPRLKIREGIPQFLSAFNDTFDTDGSLKNYGLTLKQVITDLNSRKHSQGSVVLVVKTSPEYNTGALTPEVEALIPAVLGNVKVFAIEVHGSPFPSNALERVVEMSQGSHISIARPSDLEGPLEEFFTQLKSTLQSTVSKPHKYLLALKNGMPNGEPVSVQLNSKIKKFEVFISALTGDLDADVVQLLRGEGGNYYDLNFTEASWDSAQLVPATIKSFYFSSPDHSDAPFESLSWERVSACKGMCQLLVVIAAEVEDPTMEPNIVVTFTTSAIDNVVNMGSNELGYPFAVFAKIEEDGIPIQDAEGLSVFATIWMRMPDNSISIVKTIQLYDDGSGSSDVTVNDGIFSGIFAATTFQGLHKMFVSATYKKPEPVTTTESADLRVESFNRKASSGHTSIGKLFPVDQIHIGCGSGYLGCWSKPPETEFFQSTDSIDLQFINVTGFLPYPTRITDLKVTPLNLYDVNLQWTAPGVLLAQEDERPAQGDFYEVRHHESFDDLLFNFTFSENLSPDVLPSPLLPGSRHNITFSLNREAYRYFAIRTQSVLGAEPTYSQLSVIVGVHIQNETIVTTTTTTTTVRPTATSTLPPPSTTPGPITTTKNTATTSTSPRTTSRRSTTPKSTTASTTTTTVRTTTTAKPIDKSESWFEKTEGIITLSVFGGALILLTAGGLFAVWFLKFR